LEYAIFAIRGVLMRSHNRNYG